MVKWNNDLLMEICSEVLDKENKLEQFALTGKETFLAYITLFRSVQECKTYSNLVIPTLVSIFLYEYIAIMKFRLMERSSMVHTDGII